MKRALITGGTGFIGRHCLRKILTRDYDKVHAVSRSGAPLKDIVDRRLHWHAVDLRDSAQAIRVVTELRPTHLLHSAWVATPGVYAKSSENMDWLAASMAMARAFGESGGVRFVGVGTSAEYLPGDLPCREDETPIQPATPYGKCKAACWLAVQAAAQNYGFSAAWGRVFLPYGPGDPPQRLIPSVVASLRKGQPIETTHGRQLRDFIFAPDVASLLARLLEGSEAGAFNVGTGVGTPVGRVIEELAQRLGVSSELLRFGVRPLAESEPMQLVADMDKVRRSLGWSPSTSIEQGLDWVVAQPAG